MLGHWSGTVGPLVATFAVDLAFSKPSWTVSGVGRCGRTTSHFRLRDARERHGPRVDEPCGLVIASTLEIACIAAHLVRARKISAQTDADIRQAVRDTATQKTVICPSVTDEGGSLPSAVPT